MERVNWSPAESSGRLSPRKSARPSIVLQKGHFGRRRTLCAPASDFACVKLLARRTARYRRVRNGTQRGGARGRSGGDFFTNALAGTRGLPQFKCLTARPCPRQRTTRANERPNDGQRLRVGTLSCFSARGPLVVMRARAIEATKRRNAGRVHSRRVRGF